MTPGIGGSYQNRSGGDTESPALTMGTDGTEFTVTETRFPDPWPGGA